LPGVAQLDLRGYAARDSDSAHAFSGNPSEDKRGLIGPASPPASLALLVPLHVLLFLLTLQRCSRWLIQRILDRCVCAAYLLCIAPQNPEACGGAICVEEQSEAQPRSETQSPWCRPGNSGTAHPGAATVQIKNYSPG